MTHLDLNPFPRAFALVFGVRVRVRVGVRVRVRVGVRV